MAAIDDKHLAKSFEPDGSGNHKEHIIKLKTAGGGLVLPFSLPQRLVRGEEHEFITTTFNKK